MVMAPITWRVPEQVPRRRRPAPLSRRAAHRLSLAVGRSRGSRATSPCAPPRGDQGHHAGRQSMLAGAQVNVRAKPLGGGFCMRRPCAVTPRAGAQVNVHMCVCTCVCVYMCVCCVYCCAASGREGRHGMSNLERVARTDGGGCGRGGGGGRSDSAFALRSRCTHGQGAAFARRGCALALSLPPPLRRRRRRSGALRRPLGFRHLPMPPCSQPRGHARPGCG